MPGPAHFAPSFEPTVSGPAPTPDFRVVSGTDILICSEGEILVSVPLAYACGDNGMDFLTSFGASVAKHKLGGH